MRIGHHGKETYEESIYKYTNYLNIYIYIHQGFPGCASGKEPTASAGDTGDMGLIPWSGRSAGGGNGNPLQYSCLENPMDRGAWQATVHGVEKSKTRLSTRAYVHHISYTVLNNEVSSISIPSHRNR